MQAVAKIWGAFLFQRMTDLYGNVPYTEAGYGFRRIFYKPKYDTQESIYADLIDRVKGVSACSMPISLLLKATYSITATSTNGKSSVTLCCSASECA